MARSAEMSDKIFSLLILLSVFFKIHLPYYIQISILKMAWEFL